MHCIHAVLIRAVALAVALTLPAGFARAQAPARAPASPPQAQAWIDLATYSGLGLPAGAGGGHPAAAMGGVLSGLFGAGGGGGNRFGNTQVGASGRWMDVTLMTRANPALAEATQQVPAGLGLAPGLRLQAPKDAAPPPGDDEAAPEGGPERPRGKLKLYWGCGDKVRAGQPRVLDLARLKPEEAAKFFVSRRATQRGTHSAAGRPLWPSPADARLLPASASLVGEHAYSGVGVPADFRFSVPAAQDLMPAIETSQQATAAATRIEWKALPTARGWFLAGQGGAEQAGEGEMVIWTSSEQPETGFGLLDYQTNAAVERWVREGVLLPASATHCSVPKGIFPNETAMLRMIAYGPELNLVHPPRPSDPKAAWEPVWALKLRVKSMASLMLGQPGMGAAEAPVAPAEPAKADKKPGAVDLLRGILGR